MDQLFAPAGRAQVAAVLAHHAGSDRLAGTFEAQCRAAGVSAAELRRHREGYADDPRLEAGIRFAHAALITRGRIAGRDRNAARRRGLDDPTLEALIALTADVAAEVIRANASAP